MLVGSKNNHLGEKRTRGTVFGSSISNREFNPFGNYFNIGT